MAVKVKFKNLKKVQDSIREAFSEVVHSPTLLKKVGEEVVSYTKIKSRSGFSLGSGGNRFPALADSTVGRRRALAKVNETHRAYSAARSNLTFTGQLIDSIKVLNVQASKAIVEIGPTGKRRKLKGVRGKPLKVSDANNSEVYSRLKELGFLIFGKDGALERKVLNLVKREMRRALSFGRKK